MKRRKLIALGIILVLGISAFSYAQRRGGRRGGMYYVKRPDHITWNSDFTFCRLAYNEAYDGDGGGWGVDYPRADMNLPIRLSELTKAPVNFDAEREPNHVVIQATEPELFKCPFVMMSEFGSALITPPEAEALRSYLMKGGFLWADDAWGEYAWRHWVEELRKVLPESGYPIFDVPLNHSLLHTLFDVKRIPQIPSIGNSYRYGRTDERWNDPTDDKAYARAIADEKGRIMVLITHNTDFGDAYEREADDPTYFYTFSVEGYAIGINVLLYSMTH
jgi:Domain of unknown function (DUF4159)